MSRLYYEEDELDRLAQDDPETYGKLKKVLIGIIFLLVFLIGLMLWV